MQYDDLVMTDPVIAPNEPMKAALHIEDLVITFVIIAKTDSNFLNFICIVRVIHSLCPGELGKTDDFSFFLLYVLKQHI